MNSYMDPSSPNEYPSLIVMIRTSVFVRERSRFETEHD